MPICTKQKTAIGHTPSTGTKQRPCWCSGLGFIHFPSCCHLLALVGKPAKRQVEFTWLSPNMLFSSLMTLKSNKFAQVGNKFSEIMLSLIKITTFSFRCNAIWVQVSNKMTMLHCETQDVYLDSEWTRVGASVRLHYCWGSEGICECAQRSCFS